MIAITCTYTAIHNLPLLTPTQPSIKIYLACRFENRHAIMMVHVGPMLYGSALVRQVSLWIREADDRRIAKENAQRQAREARQPTGNGPQTETSDDVVQSCSACLLIAPVVLVCTILLLFSVWWYGWCTVLGVMGILWLPHLSPGCLYGLSLFGYTPSTHVRTLLEASDTQVTYPPWSSLYITPSP